MSAFFALVFTCGYFSCEQPKSVDFNDEISCRGFVNNFVEHTPSGLGAACFDRKTGAMIAASRLIYEERKKKK